jgi:Domain of unknown function (DUF4124)
MCRYSFHEITTHVYQGTNSVTQQTSYGLLSIATAAKLARVGTLVSAAYIFSFATHAIAAPANSQSAATTNGPVIYKLVDASGRITYTNSPTKGATKVELDPITVIPSSPAGMLGGGQAAAQTGVASNAQSATAAELIPVGMAPTIAKPEAPTLPLIPMASPSTQTTFAASARMPNAQPATAVVTPVSAIAAPRVQSPSVRNAEQNAERIIETPAPPAYKLPVVKLTPRDALPGDIGIRAVADTPLVPAITSPTAPPRAPAAPIVAAPTLAPTPTVAQPSPVTVAVASVREIEPPAPVKPPLQSTSPALKFEKEEQMLAALKAQLAEQQNQSASFRAMRARLPTTIDQADPAKAAIQNDIKAQVEQHFERIRSLQDQIAQREQNLAVLRQ